MCNFNTIWIQMPHFYSLAYQVLVPKGKDGSVEVSIKLKGYNEEVLAKNEIKNAVSWNQYPFGIWTII